MEVQTKTKHQIVIPGKKGIVYKSLELLCNSSWREKKVPKKFFSYFKVLHCLKGRVPETTKILRVSTRGKTKEHLSIQD